MQWNITVASPASAVHESTLHDPPSRSLPGVTAGAPKPPVIPVNVTFHCPLPRSASLALAPVLTHELTPPAAERVNQPEPHVEAVAADAGLPLTPANATAS